LRFVILQVSTSRIFAKLARVEGLTGKIKFSYEAVQFGKSERPQLPYKNFHLIFWRCKQTKVLMATLRKLLVIRKFL
jgi:hypothetical protein